MADLEKVIRGLECCSCMDGNKCAKCPYAKECEEGTGGAVFAGSAHLCADAISIIKAQEADIKARPEKYADLLDRTLEDADWVKVVRCEDCRFWEPENAEEGDTSGRCRNNYAPCQNQQTDMTWFCADGEKVEE